MKKLFVAALLFASTAYGETKVIKLGGVHCQDCVATLKEKVCTPDTYATCDVKLTSAKKKTGEMKLVSKADAKIDMDKVKKIVEDEGYTIKK